VLRLIELSARCRDVGNGGQGRNCPTESTQNAYSVDQTQRRIQSTVEKKTTKAAPTSITVALIFHITVRKKCRKRRTHREESISEKRASRERGEGNRIVASHTQESTAEGRATKPRKKKGKCNLVLPMTSNMRQIREEASLAWSGLQLKFLGHKGMNIESHAPMKQSRKSQHEKSQKFKGMIHCSPRLLEEKESTAGSPWHEDLHGVRSVKEIDGRIGSNTVVRLEINWTIGESYKNYERKKSLLKRLILEGRTPWGKGWRENDSRASLTRPRTGECLGEQQGRRR